MTKLPPQVERMPIEDLHIEIRTLVQLIGSGPQHITEENFRRLDALTAEASRRMRRLVLSEVNQNYRLTRWRVAAVVTGTVVICVIALLLPLLLVKGA